MPKLNTPDTAIYHKGQTLYGAGEQADRIAAGAAPTLVEGPVDVCAVALAFPDASSVAVAACGTSLTAYHAAAIAAMPGTARHGVTVALDSDDAGRRGTERAWQLLSAHACIDLFAATLPDHTDPGGIITSTMGIVALRAALIDHARPLAEVVIDTRLDMLAARHPDLLRWPEGRINAIRTLASLIIKLPAQQIVALTGYIAECTNTGFDTVAHAVITNLEQLPPVRAEQTSTPIAVTPPRLRTFPPPGAGVTAPSPQSGVALHLRPGMAGDPHAIRPTSLTRRP